MSSPSSNACTSDLGGLAIPAKDLQLAARRRPCAGRNMILLVSSLDTARTHSGGAASCKRRVGVRTATEVGIACPEEDDEEARGGIDGSAIEDSTTVDRREGPCRMTLSKMYCRGISFREESTSSLVKSMSWTIAGRGRLRGTRIFGVENSSMKHPQSSSSTLERKSID